MDMGLDRRQLLRFAGLSPAALASAGLTLPIAASAAAPGEPAIANLSLNENPWGPSPLAKAAMVEHLARINRYASPETRHLQELIAAEHGVTPEMVVIGPGSNLILRLLGEMLAGDKPGSELLTGAATFESIYRGFESRGGKAVFVPFDSAMRFDVDAIAGRIGPNTAGIYICNPNNPTGTMVESAKLRAFASDASKKVPVVIDEAYIDLTDDYPVSTMVDLTRAGRNVIVCRTFSKLHGLAAARCGYAIAPAATAARIRSAASIGGLPRLALVAATASLQDKANQVTMKERLRQGRLKLVAMADSLKLTRAPDPQANFIYVKTGMATAQFVAEMKSRNVLVVQRGFPGFDDWNRICVGFDDEIAHCRGALKDVLKLA